MIYTNIAHSLSEAVKIGLITDYAAFCGLSFFDVEALATQFPKLEVLVRLRNSEADGRDIMTIEEIRQWWACQLPREIRNYWWAYRDIRDITAVGV